LKWISNQKKVKQKKVSATVLPQYPSILCNDDFAERAGTGDQFVEHMACYYYFLSSMAGTWKNFKLAMKDKRSGKRKLTPSNDILKKEEIVI
jgi:hypothetical protein